MYDRITVTTLRNVATETATTDPDDSINFVYDNTATDNDKPIIIKYTINIGWTYETCITFHNVPDIVITTSNPIQPIPFAFVINDGADNFFFMVFDSVVVVVFPSVTTCWTMPLLGGVKSFRPRE